MKEIAMLRSALSRRLLAALLGMLALLFSPRLAPADDPLEEKLDKSISLDKPIDKNTPFQDAIEFLSDRFNVRITIDKEAFKKQLQVDNVAELPVHLPRASRVSLALVLRLLASQLHGTYAVKRDRIQIVPLEKGKKLARRESKEWTEAAKNIRKKLKKPITLENGIDANTPVEDAVSFLRDRTDLAIMIDVGAFHREGINNVGDSPMQLPVQKGVALSEVLGKILDQIKGTYEITGDA